MNIEKPYSDEEIEYLKNDLSGWINDTYSSGYVESINEAQEKLNNAIKENEVFLSPLKETNK